MCPNEVKYDESNPYSKAVYKRKKYCSEECSRAAGFLRAAVKHLKLQVSNPRKKVRVT